MPSKRSFFNRTLFRKNLTRFWPLWGGAALAGAMVPLYLLLALLGMPDANVSVRDFGYALYATDVYAVPAVTAGYAILCAMAVWGYLYKSRSVGLMHTLPVDRTGLFVTNTLSGLAMMLIPYAVVGAFSLIRFRSIPGNSREITCVFFSMVTGLATGTGYVTYAIFITAVVTVAMVLFSLMPIDRRDLDYTDIFEDLFEKYLKFCEVQMVKTVNMGSMYQIVYCIEQKDRKKEKEFIDELRCRNGNLNIVCSKIPEFMEQL